jgi:hypothetical protein
MREVHPHADEDEVLRDGPCREEFYFRKGRGAPMELVSALFALYNDRFFSGQLAAVSCVVDYGQALPYVGRYDAGLVRITTHALNQGYEYFRDVMLHEMAHAYVRVVLGDKGESHGPLWRAEAERLGVYIDDEFLEIDTPLESIW